jgi:magnesium transporter
LTALTIGLMVPTLIAGVYGMNFHSMPELTWALGYPMALALMAGAMGLLFLLFRRVGWLGSSERGWPSHQDRRERR